ncbi:MAG: fucose isomerase [Armatimonadetes bacterium]|nr:fucose isomerase [Armatimonadota bacterium]
MQNTLPLLGLCPIGKFVFSNEDAVRYKEAIQAKLREWRVRFVDLEGVLEDGLVKDQSHVDTAVAHFRRAEVDGLFMPHCNFGTEGAVGMIGRKLGVPALLWGPRDEVPLPDGRRLRDTLCGLFASSKVLHKLGVPFTYIENCRLEDPAFRGGVDRFLRAVHAANIFRKGVRIGWIGQRIDFFWTTIVNESELLERFHVEVLPLDMMEFLQQTRQQAELNQELYEQKARDLRRQVCVEGFDSDRPLMYVLSAADRMLSLAEERGLDGIALQSFMSAVDAFGSYCSYAESAVSERVAFGAESDIHGVLSDLLLRRAAYGEGAAYLAEFTVRHPEDDNGILLWHEGAPLSMRHPGAVPRLGHHWILPSPLSGMSHFRLKDGPLTVCRFDGDGGDYRLALGQGESMEGPDTLNNYVWMKVDNWPRWERTLMEGPYIHHVAMAYGHHADALEEACKYIDGLKAVRLDRA